MNKINNEEGMKKNQKRNKIMKINNSLTVMTNTEMTENTEISENLSENENENFNFIDVGVSKGKNNFLNLGNKIIISPENSKKNEKFISEKNEINKKARERSRDKGSGGSRSGILLIRNEEREKLNFFDISPSTIPSLSRPAIALKKRNLEENGYLKINSIEIKPKFNFEKIDDSVDMIEIAKNKKKRKMEMLSRRESNIIYRVQLIQNEIIKNINIRKQLYYYGNKAITGDKKRLSKLDKNGISKETKRRINEITKENEKLKKKLNETYLKFREKKDFSDFGIYKNFFFFVGDFSDAFWNEVKKIIKRYVTFSTYAV